MSVILAHKAMQEENFRMRQRLKELEKENSILRSIRSTHVEENEGLFRSNSLLSITSEDCCGDALASPLTQSLECFDSSEEDDGWANGGEAQYSPILSMFSSSSKESSSSCGTKSTNRMDDGYGSLLADVRRSNSDPLVGASISVSTPKPSATLPHGTPKRGSLRVFDLTKQYEEEQNDASNSTNSSLSFSPDQPKPQISRERLHMCNSDSSFDSPPRRFSKNNTKTLQKASSSSEDSLLEKNLSKTNAIPISKSKAPAVKRMLTITRSLGAKFKSKSKRGPPKA
ncbi:unnamed protein product [Dimorphilus gyrociliatus]|uniref:Uncharacterized protein n=1 Tax=Dimorphilus gyrociliatus TaxID=2664684 RepID=A0A7I8W2H4_9ANNE|nr:unnamed protein product [Dimorphilus gyrociliatus]